MADENDLKIAMALNYVECDREAAILCAKAVEHANIPVWPSSATLEDTSWAPTLEEAAKALVECRIYVGLLSHASVADKFFCDRMSLAYISNKSIQPVGLGSPSDLKKSMDPGLKLIILSINWMRIREPNEMTQQFVDLAEHVSEELRIFKEEDEEALMEDADNPHQTLSLRRRLLNAKEHNEPTFWQLHIGSDTKSAPCETFANAFFDAFAAEIDRDFGPEWQKWLRNLLIDHLLQSQVVLQNTYESIITGKELPTGTLSSKELYEHFRDYAIATDAMHHVLDLESSVRLTVIRNVSRFQTPFMISRLVSMLKESDPNVRAVAALALGKSQNKVMEPRVIAALLTLLDSKLSTDRLVRESTILALGHLRAHASVKKLTHLWRNDPIRDVREAADLALSKIGGDEVAQLRSVTEKMSEEVAFLRKLKS